MNTEDSRKGADNLKRKILVTMCSEVRNTDASV